MKKIQDKRAALLEAALELIAENGLNGSSTAAIARQAGVGTGTLFLYFKSKDDLIQDLYRDVQTRIAGAIAPLPGTQALDERFLGMMSDLLQFFLRYPRMLIFCEYYHFSRFRNALSDVPEALQHLSDLLDEGRKTGLVRDLPLFVLESLAISPLVSITREQFCRGAIVDEELMGNIVRACWDAVRVTDVLPGGNASSTV